MEPGQSGAVLGADNWDRRWAEHQTPWDLGGATPALVAWARQNSPSGLRVLIPGCGAGHDAHFLAKWGARVEALDYAPQALDRARELYPQSPVQWVLGDVTQLNYRDQFDRVWEYTCFCALLPAWREVYLDGIARALKVGGVYWGLVFETVPRPEAGPPFAIDPMAFRGLLEQRFQVDHFEVATARSVRPRRGQEIWFEVHKQAATPPG